MKKRFQVTNFYKQTLNGDLNLVDGIDGIIPITVPSIEDNKDYYILIDPLDFTGDRTVVRCYNEAGVVKYYGWSYTGNHSFYSKTDVQINDVAELFNALYDRFDDFGYTEKRAGLKIYCSGGRVFVGGSIDVVCNSLEITLTDNTTTYVYYDHSLNVFDTTTIEPISYFVCAKVTTLAGYITEVLDYRANIVGSGSAGGGGHIIKNTDQGGTDSTLTQRDALRFKKLKVSDDNINLETIVEGKWVATPDVIAVGDTEYIEADTQMIVEGSLDIQGTLVNDGKLILI